jgi:hypothetical protein
VYVAPLSLAGIRNPQQRTNPLTRERAVARGGVRGNDGGFHLR